MSYALPTTQPGPDQSDVDRVRQMLDDMSNFRDNDQRARYLLTSDWLRDRGAAAAQRLAPRQPDASEGGPLAASVACRRVMSEPTSSLVPTTNNPGARTPVRAHSEDGFHGNR